MAARSCIGGKIVTSEMLKFAIEVAILEAGGVSSNTIVAGGDQRLRSARTAVQRSDPPPHELIVVDIFPRVTASGYHGDMTRTFLRGRASEAQRALVAAVRAAQLAALKMIRAGVNGRDVHQAKCVEVFTARGFEDEAHARRARSAFSTAPATGSGLAVHEPPRVSRCRRLSA